MSNKGIIVSGNGRIDAGQVVAGTGATAHYAGAPAAHAGLEQKLDALLASLQAAEVPAARRDELTRAVGRLKDEARSPRPQKSAIETGLATLARAGASIAGISGAVKAVIEVADLVFFS